MEKVNLRLLGPRLKELIDLRCGTQKRFAEEINATEVIVSQWVNSKSVPTFKTMARIADYFGTGIDYFVIVEKNGK